MREKQMRRLVARAWRHHDSTAGGDSPLLDPEQAMTRRYGDPLLVAALVAAVEQRRHWPVAVVTSERRALVAHQLCGPPFVLSVIDEGRIVDAHDYAEEGDILWLCPHEIAHALDSRRRHDRRLAEKS